MKFGGAASLVGLVVPSASWRRSALFSATTSIAASPGI